jgi:hypothetical protein
VEQVETFVNELLAEWCAPSRPYHNPHLTHTLLTACSFFVHRTHVQHTYTHTSRTAGANACADSTEMRTDSKRITDVRLVWSIPPRVMTA